MKKELKGFVLGVLITSVLLTGTTVFAGTKLIRVLIDNTKILLNGNVVKSSVETLTYNGTTYISTDTIADVLGFYFKIDKQGKKIEIFTKEVSNNTENGNTTGNIINSGLYTKVGDWIYYANEKGKPGLYKMTLDGKSKIKISDSSTSNIIVYNGTIYYTASQGLYKCKDDGTNVVKLDFGGCSSFHISGEHLIYTKYETGVPNNLKNYPPHRLYYMNIDGTEKNRICSDYVKEKITVDKDWVYYSKITEIIEKTEPLYKIKFDGTSKTKICDDSVYYMNIKDDWIYCANNSDHWYLYKIKVDGSVKIKLNNEFSQNIYLYQDWIIYQGKDKYYSDRPRLCKIQLSGEERTVIDNIEDVSGLGNISSISVIDDSIFYLLDIEKDDEYITRMVKIFRDGSGREVLWETRVKKFYL